MTKETWRPIPVYTVTYRGEALHKESKARNALARIPEDGRGWKILCHLGEGEGPRIVFDGNRQATPKEVAA